MNSQEAKEILLLYRPDTADAEEPAVVQAMETARRDPELGRWFEQHCAFQAAMRAKFRQIEVPEHLEAALLARQKIVPLPVWRRQPVWLAAAAALVLLLGLAGMWLRPAVPDHFVNYRTRMISTALRDYRMDIETKDMQQLRQWMAQSGAPADYEVPKGLEHLQLTGGGRLRWRSHPVAMVCFNRGDNQMLFLFVMDRAAVKDPPPQTPQPGQTNGLLCFSWTKGDKTYVLAGPQEKDFAQKYL